MLHSKTNKYFTLVVRLLFFLRMQVQVVHV